MTSATAHLADDLAHRGALDAPTLPAAAHAAAIATSIAAVTAAHGRPTVVRRVQEATSRLTQLEELRRAQWKARTT
jgi:hypothetical protein